MRALEPVGVQGASLAELATQQAHQDGEDAMRVKVTPLMELREEKEKCWAGKLQRARLRGTTYDCKDCQVPMKTTLLLLPTPSP